MSAQPCGCDPTHHNGYYRCSEHARLKVEEDFMQSLIDAQDKSNMLEGIRTMAQDNAGLNRDLIKDGRGALTGIGGAPTRATTLPDAPAERKKYPVASGVLDYFPDALVALSNVSWRGNEQHNPGQPLHWARGKSSDESDTMIRHFLQRGSLDSDGIRHSAKMVWRALAILQKEIEAEKAQAPTVREHFENYAQGQAQRHVKTPPVPDYKALYKDPNPTGRDNGPRESEPQYRARMGYDKPQQERGLTPDDRYQS